MLLGVGPIVIDKENGTVYTTGSNFPDIIEDFTKYKNNKKSIINWKECIFNF